MRPPIGIALVLVVACQPGVRAPTPTSAIAADISVLASPVLAGRATGTAGADSAAEFIARRYERLGLRPAFVLRCNSAAPCPASYFQQFRMDRGVAQNIGAIVDGADTVLRTQFVVVGAHYDHLGHSPTFALDRAAGFVTRPGADDNASGTAALLELARRFRDRPTRRSLLFVNFDAEELGLIGSGAFLVDPPIPTAAMTFMLNLDMIGRLHANRLFVEGARTRALRALIDDAVGAVGLRADYVEDEGRSDHATFLASGVEAVALSTGYHADYHTRFDVAARINFAGVDRVVDVAETIIRGRADR